MAKLGDKYFLQVYDDCVFDICQTGIEAVVCEHGKAIADECLANGIPPNAWRTINKNCGLYKRPKSKKVSSICLYILAELIINR